LGSPISAARPSGGQLHDADVLALCSKCAERQRWAVIDRPRGEAHPLYPDMIYPYDYGHIPGKAAADGDGIDVFVGAVQTGLVGLIALTHQPSGIADPKLLVNLTRDDADAIIAFLDRGDPAPDLRLVWRRPAR
jgi:inorganic pyrophosphatase